MSHQDQYDIKKFKFRMHCYLQKEGYINVFERLADRIFGGAYFSVHGATNPSTLQS